MLQHAAARLTQNAKAVGVVEQQPGVMPFAQLEQGGHRRNIAVHTEDGIADHQLAPRGMRGERAFEHRQIAVHITLELGA